MLRIPVRILLLLEHHINNQLEKPSARYSRTLECKYIPDFLTVLHAGRTESLRRMELAPSTPLNKAVHSPTTSYNMAEEHYVLLQVTPNFAHRFSLIFINTINHIESLHFEYHHKTVEIISRMINILQTNLTGPSFPPTSIDPNADSPPTWTTISRATLAHLNLPNIPNNKSWTTNIFTLLLTSPQQHLQGYRNLCHQGRTDFFNDLQRLIKVLRAGNLQIMASEDTFQTNVPQTFVPTPFPTPPSGMRRSLTHSSGDTTSSSTILSSYSSFLWKASD